MTKTELVAYVRLQIAEDVAGFYEDEDIESYIDRAVIRFVDNTSPVIIHTEHAVDESKQAEAAVSEVFTVTCVADDTGAINDQYFKIYDVDDTEYLVWYNVNDAGTAPTGDNLIEVAVGTDETNTDVASLTSSAINATTGFSATVNSEVVTVTVAAGYITTDAANVNVDNGTDELAIAITTDGLDEYFDLGYDLQKEKGAILVSEAGDRMPMTRVSYEDWKFFDDSSRGDSAIYYVDERYPDRLYIPVSLTGATVHFYFQAKAATANIDSFLANNDIPEEYHETIAKYAICQALRRDKQRTEAREYLNEYLLEEKQAAQKIGNRQQSSYMDDFSMDITNPHRDTSELIGDGMVV